MFTTHCVCSFCRDSMATFDNLWETFPDENCVLTNRELLVEVRRKTHNKQARFTSVFTVLTLGCTCHWNLLLKKIYINLFFTQHHFTFIYHFHHHQ